jgi:hypothetical protein
VFPLQVTALACYLDCVLAPNNHNKMMLPHAHTPTSVTSNGTPTRPSLGCPQEACHSVHFLVGKARNFVCLSSIGSSSMSTVLRLLPDCVMRQVFSLFCLTGEAVSDGGGQVWTYRTTDCRRKLTSGSRLRLFHSSVFHRWSCDEMHPPSLTADLKRRQSQTRH